MVLRTVPVPRACRGGGWYVVDGNKNDSISSVADMNRIEYVVSASESIKEAIRYSSKREKRFNSINETPSAQRWD